MTEEFKLNEGERITEFHQNEYSSDFEIIMVIFGIIIGVPIGLYFVSEILIFFSTLLFSFDLNELIFPRIKIFFVLIGYILLFLAVWKAHNSTESAELYYFNDYILLKKIPYFKLPNFKFEPLKLPYESIDYFVLEYGRISITLKKDGEKSYVKLNKDYFGLENLSFLNLKLKIEHLSLKTDKKFTKNKIYLVNYLNYKIKTKSA